MTSYYPNISIIFQYTCNNTIYYIQRIIYSIFINIHSNLIMTDKTNSHINTLLLNNSSSNKRQSAPDPNNTILKDLENEDYADKALAEKPLVVKTLLIHLLF